MENYSNLWPVINLFGTSKLDLRGPQNPFIVTFELLVNLFPHTKESSRQLELWDLFLLVSGSPTFHIKGYFTLPGRSTFNMVSPLQSPIFA